MIRSDTSSWQALGERSAAFDRISIYHFHAKVMLERTAEWVGVATRFGYWYQVGAWPDLLSAILPWTTTPSGMSMQLQAARTARRLAHGVSGEQAGVDKGLGER